MRSSLGIIAVFALAVAGAFTLALVQRVYAPPANDDNVELILGAIRPAVHAKGTDYSVETVPEIDTAKRLGIETVIVGDPKSHASRDVLGRIRAGKDAASGE